MTDAADMFNIVSVWTWIPLAIVMALAVSAVAGLALGAILGQIGREIGQLLEGEPSAVTPMPAERVARAR